MDSFPLCRECWAGKRRTIRAADVARAFADSPETPRTVMDALRSSLVLGPHLGDGSA